MSLSIVIPCRNEQDSIETVICGFYKAASAWTRDLEILVIDDCSTDRTPEVLKALRARMPELCVLRPERNLRHGGAVRLGYEKASREFIFQTDSDSQFDPADFAVLWSRIETADMVLGFRKIRRDPWPRLVISGMLTFLIAMGFRRRVRDANCPFRLMRRDKLRRALEAVPAESAIPNILLVLAALETGMKVVQVPVRHFPRTTGQVSLRGGKLLRLCLRSAGEIFSLRARLKK